MSTNPPSDHEAMTSQQCLSSFCGGSSRFSNDRSTVVLSSVAGNMTSAIQESLDQVFGSLVIEKRAKADEESHEPWLEL